MRLHRCKTVTKLLFNQTINMNNNCNQTSLQWNLWSWPWFCVPYGNWRFVTDVWVCSVHEGVFHTKLVCVQSVHAHGFTRLTNLGAPLLLWLISNFTCVCVHCIYYPGFYLIFTCDHNQSELERNDVAFALSVELVTNTWQQNQLPVRAHFLFHIRCYERRFITSVSEFCFQWLLNFEAFTLFTTCI